MSTRLRRTPRVPALRKTWVAVLGWVLVLAGLIALVLPGPGMLLLLAGLVVLSQEYPWAQRRVEPVKQRAFDAAAAGVATWPRIALSTASGLLLVTAGVLWWVSPPIPSVWFVGPRLPFAGAATGISIITSGVVALALLVYSIRRFRHGDRGRR